MAEQSNNTTYKFSDSTIAQIVQLIQLGILTGTDVSDQMRIMKVIVDQEDGTIKPDPAYLEMFQENLKRMQSSENE